MSPDDLDDPACGLWRRWARCYTDFLLTALALRALLRSGRPAGCAQDLLTDKARAAAEVADYLTVLGVPPASRLAGGEAELWRAAVRYLDSAPRRLPAAEMTWPEVRDAVEQCQNAWRQFCAVLLALPEEAVACAPVLDPARPWSGGPDRPPREGHARTPPDRAYHADAEPDSGHVVDGS